MPWNGSGVFARVYSWVADASAGLDILADRMDQDTDDIAQGLMHCLTVNGETVPVANLPMANYRHTGASAGVADTDYVTVGQIKNGGGGLPSGGYLPLSGGTISGLLTVNGDFHFAQNLVTTNSGDAYLITGNPTFVGSLVVLNNNLTVDGSITTNSIGVTHDVSLGGTLHAGNVQISAALSANSMAIAGSATIGVTLTAAQLSGNTLSVSGAATIGGTLSGNALSVSGAATIGGTLSGNALSVSGAATIGGTLSGNTLSVSGAATIAGGVSGNLTVSGNITGQQVTGMAGLGTNGSLSVEGAAAIGGLATLWGASFANSIYPARDNFIQCGVPGNAWWSVESYGFTQASDRRSKIDLTPLDADCLDLVRAIAPQRFRWIGAPAGEKRHWGFVAQDVAAAMAQAGHEFGGHLVDPATGRERLAYNELVAVLWRAVQELAQRLDAMSTPAGEPPAGLPA